MLGAGAPATGGTGGTTSARHGALLLIGVSAALVVLALALAITSLRRRMAGPVAAPRPAPATPE
ncbi:hypothetical protein C1I99_25770 [Micromonospora deserti]|uniref:Uncharacterized protein n=1 Tax=Micromonospora deserti TaxID=2070366 RepID=A0A2W2BSB7_9ACTN|nr:hypothetical protein C1I99_25770 [Micromonospora deserti]